MTTEISKTNIIENTWKNFRDRLSSLGSVSITGGTNVSVQTFVSSFPDNSVDTKSDYPILVVEPPKISTESFTLGKDQVNGTITVEIYTNQAESADKFMSKIIDSIETFRDDLAGVGLHNIQIDSTDSDHVQRDQIKIHVRRTTWNFKYRFSRTRSY
jgi:hypothetical protein